MVRKHQPGLIIEIGSGHSTHFAMDALHRNQRGRIISIDPEPRRSLPASVDHIQSKVEAVNLDLFDSLQANDILFIDSSHTTDEARYHCAAILPRLQPGVVIHHHDVTYPYNIYFYNDPQAYAEPDVLYDFYQAHQQSFEILVGDAYVRYRAPEVINRLIPSYAWNPSRIPGSLWARKRS